MTPAAVFQIDPLNQCVWRLNGGAMPNRLPLTPKAFSILQYLLEHRDRLITHEELLESLWPNQDVQPEVLKSYILAIRQALGDKVEQPRFIETLRGRGYRFIAPPGLMPFVARDPALPASEPPLVGRDAQLALLGRMLDRAKAGEPQVALITGEPGIGKSTLIKRFITQAGSQAELHVGIGRSLQGFGGGRMPYQALLDAFDALCDGPRRASLVRLLIDTAPTWANQMASRLSDDQRARVSRAAAGATRERLLREGCEFLEALADAQPLLLVLEDLHWADFATLDFVVALAARNRRPARRLLVLSFRPRDLDRIGPQLTQWTGEMLARRLAQEISLPPLTESEVTAYVGGPQPASGSRALAHLAWRHAGGNPLFLLATLDHLLARGLVTHVEHHWEMQGEATGITLDIPDTLSRLIEALFERLTDSQQRVLEVGCVTGMSFNAAYCARAIEVDSLRFEELCEELCRRSHFLSRGEIRALPNNQAVREYQFDHELYRHVLYDRLGPLRRARLELDVAGRMEEIFPPPERIPVLAELVQHFAAGRDWLKALDYLRLALKVAHRRFAYRDGVAILERAASITESLPAAERVRAELEFLERRAAIYGAAHDEQTLTVYQQLFDKAGQLGDINMQVRALLGSAYAASWHDVSAGMAFLDRALPLTAQQPDAISRYRARITIHVRRIWVSGWSDTDSNECEEALRLLAQQGNALALARGVLDVSMVRLLSTRYRNVLEQFSGAYQCLLDNADAEGEADVARATWMHHVGTPWAALFLGDFGRCMAVQESGVTTFERNADASSALALRTYGGLPLFFAGDYPGVLQVCGPVAAQALGKQASMTSDGARTLPVEQRISLIFCGLAELESGQVERALEYLQAALALLRTQPVHLDWYWRLPLEWGMVQTFIAQNQHAAAASRAEMLVDLAERTREYTWRSLAWQVRARAALARGCHSEALACAEKAFTAGRTFEAPLALWRAHDTAARIHHELGNSTQAQLHAHNSFEIRAAAADTLPEGHALRATLLAPQPFP